MKKLIFAASLIFAPSLIMAQNADCKKFVSNFEDEVEGTSYSASNHPILLKDMKLAQAISIDLLKTQSSSLIMSIECIGLRGCIDEGNKINFLFTDGTRSEIANKKDFNCDGKAVLYFGGIFGNEDTLEMLKTKRIKTIRVWNDSSNFIQLSPNEQNQNNILNTVSCLMN